MTVRFYRRPPRRRGFGTFLAILLLLLVAAILPALGAVFAADAQRTRAHAVDAQLRQLLTAGAVFATHQAGDAAASTTQRSIPLPKELTDDGAAVTCSFSRAGSDDHLTATVHATLGPRTMEQTIEFQRRDGHWQPVAATLNPPAPPAPDVR